MQNPDHETRIIAIGDKEKLLGDLFGGITVNANGSVRVGEVDIHPQEIGPALSRAVMAMNDYVEEESGLPRKGDRAMFLTQTADGSKKRKMTDLERLTNWLYTSEDTFDIRVRLLGAIVKDLRQHPTLQK